MTVITSASITDMRERSARRFYRRWAETREPKWFWNEEGVASGVRNYGVLHSLCYTCGYESTYRERRDILCGESGFDFIWKSVDSKYHEKSCTALTISAIKRYRKRVLKGEYYLERRRRMEGIWIKKARESLKMVRTHLKQPNGYQKV